MQDRRRSITRRRSALLVLAALLLVPRIAPAGTTMLATTASSASPDLADIARGVARGGALRIESTELDGTSSPASLDLVRFEPASSRTRLVVQGEHGATEVHPELPVYFRGSVDGMRGSIAVLSVRPSGEIRGIVSAAGGTWTIARSEKRGSALRSRRTDRQAPSGSRKYSCDVLENPLPARTASAAPTSRALRLPIAYTANIAVELDYDYYQLFAPDTDAAMLYALDLMAFTGTLGESELGMNVEVPFLLLWTTELDPYSSSTTARLGQVRTRWNQTGATNCGGYDCTAIARSTVLLLSAETNGGVAFVPGLCDSYHSANGFSYAFVGGLGGDFDVDSPSAVWDVVATTHELGHNFGSEHTHCYNPPIDDCYGGEGGCYAGVTSLPSGCPGAGQGCGTIMSYCHLLSGGLHNISLTYGLSHPYGDAPERVTSVMAAQLATEFAAAPACLSPTAGLAELSVDKTGTGDGTITSTPSGIDCGAACRSYFDADSVVTLTATPGEFSTFSGWSGDPDCADGVVTVSAATSCTATFTGACGVDHLNCDDGDVCTVDSCPAGDHCEHAGTPRDAGSCFAAAGTRLKITNSTDPAKNRFAWQWSAGEAFVQADLGDPASTTDYSLCVYDSTGETPFLTTSLSIPHGVASWRNNTPDGWSWSDGHSLYDGVRKMQIKTGAAGKTKIKLAALGTALPLPLPVSLEKYFDEDTSVIVQLLTSDDRCWTSTFVEGGTSANTPLAFKAAGD